MMKETKEREFYDDVRMNRWREYKICANAIGEAVMKSKLDDRLKAKAIAINGCSNFLLFAENKTTGEKKFKRTFLCRQRLCPICQWRRASRQRYDLIGVVDRVSESDFLFITLTAKNCDGEELRETIKWMNNSFYKFYKNRLNNERKKGFCSGYYKQIEVTYNKDDNTYHPHIHVLAAIDNSYYNRNRIKLKEWQLLWQKYLGIDYLPRVTVKSVKKGEEKLLRICSYITKANVYVNAGDADFTAERFELMDRQLRNLRMFATGGVFEKARKRLKIKNEIKNAYLLPRNTQYSNQEEWEECIRFFNDNINDYVARSIC